MLARIVTAGAAAARIRWGRVVGARNGPGKDEEANRGSHKDSQERTCHVSPHISSMPSEWLRRLEVFKHTEVPFPAAREAPPSNHVDLDPIVLGTTFNRPHSLRGADGTHGSAS